MYAAPCSESVTIGPFESCLHACSSQIHAREVATGWIADTAKYVKTTVNHQKVKDSYEKHLFQTKEVRATPYNWQVDSKSSDFESVTARRHRWTLMQTSCQRRASPLG